MVCSRLDVCITSATNKDFHALVAFFPFVLSLANGLLLWLQSCACVRHWLHLNVARLPGLHGAMASRLLKSDGRVVCHPFAVVSSGTTWLN